MTADEPSVTVSEDESVTLSCNVDSQPTTSIEVSWFKDNGTTPLQDNCRINIGSSGSIYELTISSAMATDQGIYKCVANNNLIPQDSAANITLTITGIIVHETRLSGSYYEIFRSTGARRLLDEKPSCLGSWVSIPLTPKQLYTTQGQVCLYQLLVIFVSDLRS